MKKHLLKFLSIALVTSFLFSCGGGGSSKEETNADKKQEIDEFVEKEFTYPIPTSFEVTQLLTDANTSFNIDVVNGFGLPLSLTIFSMSAI